MFFDSQIFSTAQLSQLLQVSESTIKRWADSGTLKCFKTPGGHRKFRLHDVLEFLDRNGYEALGFLVRPKEEFEDFRVHWQITRGNWEGLSELCQQMLLNGEREKMFVLMSNCVTRQVPLAKIFDLVILPAMARIDRAWEAGDLRVYEEHRATQTLTEVISHLTQVLHKKVKGSGVAVLACPENEHYYLSLAIAALLLEEQGWTMVNLGPDNAWSAILESIEDIRPHLVVYSATAPEDKERFVAGARDFAEKAKTLDNLLVAIGSVLSVATKEQLGCDAVAQTYEELLAATEGRLQTVVKQRRRRGARKVATE